MRSLFLSSIWIAQTLFVGTNLAGVELKPVTIRDFNQYVQVTEARIQKQVAHPDSFLYFDNLPEPRRSQVHIAILRGDIFMDRLQSRDPSGAALEIRDGLVHHWIGAVFIPKGTVRLVVDLVEDYNHHQDVYRPDVVRSRLLSHNDDEFKVFMRFRQKKVITVTLNTQHDVRYTRLDNNHWYSQSVATRIAEVENADKTSEREKPPGNDSGFLWRLNSYWRFVEREGGVYVEVESISLTRNIPTGLGWLVGPFVTSVPRESLQRTLGSTRSAILARSSRDRNPRSTLSE
jgi:hypothetical protein